MIKKFWNKNHEKYDAQFDRATDNLWKIWKDEVNASVSKIVSVHNIDAFKNRFGYEPIRINDNSSAWAGLIFKDTAEYMLFLLEWS
jgi:thiamine biosynthesis lipoprotein ApbE